MSGRLCALLGFALAATASATPRPLPFTYLHPTSPKGDVELEQFVDITPVRALSFSGKERWEPRYTLNTEVEYGLTDRLEVALYFQLANAPGEVPGMAPLYFDGIKQRVRYRLAETGEWPVDVALYFEVAELREEIELEAKVILQRQLGPVRLAANLWLEHEFYYDGERDWVFHPTLGATLELSPSLHVGAEYWLHAEVPAREVTTLPFADLPHHYLGPTLLWQPGKLWLSVGAYVRLDDLSRAAEQNDVFGRFWVRSIVGLSL